MGRIIDKASGSINMDELSKYNGKTHLENLETIMAILLMKSEVYNKPQTLILTLKRRG